MIIKVVLMMTMILMKIMLMMTIMTMMTIMMMTIVMILDGSVEDGVDASLIEAAGHRGRGRRSAALKRL